MKKQITIIQDGVSPVVVDDSDDRPLDEYTVELSKLLESNNVSIITTTSCKVIIRPNKVTSMIVREFASTDVKETIQQQKTPEGEIKEPEDSPDGIVSD
jgi:hypothetical protein